MAVFKRYKGRRIKPNHPAWAQARWWMEFTLNVQHVCQPIPGAHNLADAKRAENRAREAIYSGRFEQSSVRFTAFVDDIYLPWAKRNKKSFAHDESRAQPLKRFFGNRDLRQITPILIEEFKSKMLGGKTHRGTDRKGATVNRYLQLLSKIFSMAYFNGLVDSNPCTRVRKEREGGRRERYLTHEEEHRLMKVLVGDLSYLLPAVTVALGTGLRKAELLALRFEHINFAQLPFFYPVNGKEVEVRPNSLLVVESKNGKPRRVPMNPVVRETLTGLARFSEYEGEVFSYARNGVSDETIRNGYPRACKAADIPYGQTAAGGIVWHDLRHTFATRLLESGVHELDIMKLMGHLSLKMTASYAHSTHAALQNAVNKLTEKRGEIVEFGRKVG